MKYLASISLLILLFSCKKETANTTARLLSKVTVNGKLDESFSYDAAGRLTNYQLFSLCTTNPMDEDIYHYQGDKIAKVEHVIRSIYSSSISLCDPAAGLRSESVFEYNTQGQLVKVSTANSHREFYYNAKGFLEKEVIDGNGQYTFLYEYDTRGNMIKYTDNVGNITQYEYDNKINPYHLARYRAGTVMAFNVSPNNVIKGTGSAQFTRSFKYNNEGLPISVVESSNGFTYLFEYK